MPAAAGDFQSAFDGLLAFHVGEIKSVFVRLIEQSGQVHARRRNFHFAFEKTHHFAQILNWDDLQSFEARGLGCVVLRHEQADFAFGLGAQSDS